MLLISHVRQPCANLEIGGLRWLLCALRMSLRLGLIERASRRTLSR